MAYSLFCKTGRRDRDDIFLESQSLYRKQMPSDGNDLFRVVAEQMYDSQTLHFEVRKACVRFLTLKRRLFEKQIQGDFDKYTLRMSWPHTRGGMIEMRAMCLLYRRNLRIHEFNKPSVVITYSKQFRQLFTIYYTSQHHFEIVYTLYTLTTRQQLQLRQLATS